MKLREYQQRCVDLTIHHLEMFPESAPIVWAATGSGKSLIASALADALLDQYSGQRGAVLVLAHRKELIAQNHAKLPKHLRGSIFSASLKSKDLTGQVIFASIQSISKHWHKLPKLHAIVIDEAQWATKGYREFVDNVMIASPACRVIGLTATPYNGAGVWLHMLPKDRLFSGICAEVGIGELLKLGYLCPVTPFTSQTRLSTDGVKVDAKTSDFAQKELQAAVDVPELVQACAAEIQSIFVDRNSVLVFCAGVDHAEHVAQALTNLGEIAAVVTGGTSGEERDRHITDFKEGRVKYLISVDVLSVGFDAPNADGLACLRPTKSPLVWVQMCLDMETEVLTSHGWKDASTMRVGDCALSLDESTGKGVWSHVVEVIQRPMLSSEKWVEYNAPRANFRVTDQHRMLYSTKNFSGEWVSKSGPALEMADVASAVRMPTSVHMDQPGVPLTDDELWFIGMMMTDGTWGHYRAEISQSERHPEIIHRIENTLNAMGVQWVKVPVPIPDAKSLIKERHARWKYRIPMNFSRVGGAGVGYLQPYLSKDLSPALFAMSARQFEVLLDGIWAGDGFKTSKAPSCDWTPRSKTICTARKLEADRLQALGVMNGYTVHSRSELGGRTNPIYILTFTKKDWRSVGGVGSRPQITVRDATNENVWCVKTTAGTIVTRRRGKVTVMGNCGRLMRLHDGKSDGLVADFTSNSVDFPPLDEIEGSPPKITGGSAPVKVCDECFSVILAGLRKCPVCGHEFVFNERDPHKFDADTGLLISGVMKNEDGSKTYPIERVDYRSQTTRSGALALVVEYYSAGRKSPVSTEYLNLWHHSPAEAQRAASKWLRRMKNPGSGGVPMNIGEALARASLGALKEPKTVTVKPGSPFPIRFTV